MKRIVLVLGGGGMKGLAHVGAYKAVVEAGLEVEEVIGTSIGALVAACIGGGLGWADLAPRGLALRKPDIVAVNRWALLLNGIRQPSIFLDVPLRRTIEAVLPVGSFEELSIPVGVNAVDLESGTEEWFGAGGRMDVPLAEAVYASCALPLFYPPAEIEGRVYVDGGVLDALPIGRARERGATAVVAVDVGAGPEREALDTVEQGLVAIHHRVQEIQGYARKRARLEAWRAPEWDGPPLVYVRPRLDRASTFDFAQTRYFLEEGYRATRKALAQAGWERAAVPAD